MGIYKNTPPIVTSGLTMYVDPGNRVSYVSGSSTIFDLSGNNINGTLTNGPAFINNNQGYINFDGTNDYITFGTVLNPATPSASFSMGVWVTLASTASSAAGGIIGKNYSGGNKIRWGVYYPNVTPPTSKFRYLVDWDAEPAGTANDGNTIIIPNVWYYVVMTIDRSTAIMNLYVDGKIDNKITISGTGWGSNTSLSTTATNNPFVSGFYNNSTYYLSGSISCIQFYNSKALTDKEVMQNYNALRFTYP